MGVFHRAINIDTLDRDGNLIHSQTLASVANGAPTCRVTVGAEVGTVLIAATNGHILAIAHIPPPSHDAFRNITTEIDLT